MTAGLRIDLDADAALAGLDRAIATLADPRPLLDEIGGRLETSTRLRFETGRSPDGAAWPASARAKRQSGQTLVDTGRLRDSIAHVVRGSGPSAELLVGTDVAYAAIHQFGGRTPPRTIRPKRKKALWWPGAPHPVASVDHPGSTIPARPWLGLSDGDRARIARIVARHLPGGAA